MSAREPIALVGDGVENPWNARTMIAAAGMFGGRCLFRDRAGLASAWHAALPPDADLPLISREELAGGYSPVVALDNLPGAVDVYGCRLPAGPRPALVVGNERRGIAREIQTIADRVVQIPMESRNLNCLNVAAAAAVALYYLSRGGGGRQPATIHPQRRRPELLLLGAADHVELGSSIRSAGAFGWERVFVEDREGVWFGCDRVVRSEGRAAARRARNPIRLIPATAGQRYAFDEVCVVTARREGVPLHKATLARGPRQAIAIADESRVDVAAERWDRLGRTVRFVYLDLPCRDFAYHYRLIATVALAEVARQVGRRARPEATPPVRHEPFYDRSLAVLAQERGETVLLEDLVCY
jgi:hypothetical protein